MTTQYNISKFTLTNFCSHFKVFFPLFQPSFAGLDDTFDSAEIETEMGDLDDIGDEVKINVK